MSVKRISLIIAFVCLFWAFASIVWAQSKSQQESLRGLKGVCVLIEDIGSDAEEVGLTKSQLTTDVELKLRMAGIRVLTLEEVTFIEPLDFPALYVNVGTMKTNTGQYLYMIEVSFSQWVRLNREPSIKTAGTTWAAPGVSGVVNADNMRTIRESVGDMIDKFTNDYLAVNPK